MLGCPSERIEFTAGMLAGEEDWWSVHSKPSRCPIYHDKGWALTSCLSESEGGSPEEEKSVRLFVSRLISDTDGSTMCFCKGLFREKIWGSVKKLMGTFQKYIYSYILIGRDVRGCSSFSHNLA